MSQDNIFQEIDEELRSDRMRAMWRRFGPFVIGAAVAVVAIVAVNEGWTWYHANNAAQSSDELYAAFEAIDGGDLASAQTQLSALMVNGSGSYPVLAQFRKAGVLAKEGKLDEAVAADAPTITRTILADLQQRLAGDPELAPDTPVPFYYMRHRRFCRELL